jgi:hypothetical protein
MSRGPGRIERSIRELFDANPDLAFVTDELCEHCYPGVRPIERKHQIAVLRAARNVLKADPNWTAKRECGDQGNRWKFYNRDSGESRLRGLRPKSKQPVPHEWEWVNFGPGFGRARRKVPREPHEAVSDTRARKRDDRAQDDVAWHRLVRDADEVTRKRMLEAYRAISSDWKAWTAWMDARRAWMTRPDVWLKRYQARAVIGQETLKAAGRSSEPIIIPSNEAMRLAARARALINTNDPDAVRAGLAEIADALDAISRGRPGNLGWEVDAK